MENFNSSPDNKNSSSDHVTKKMWWEFPLQTKMNDMNLMGELNNRVMSFKSDMASYHSNVKNMSDFYEEKSGEHSRDKVKNRFGKSWNLLRVTVDAHHSRVANITPRATFQTKNSTIKCSQIAIELDDYFLNLFLSSKVHEASRDAYKDGLVSNLGIMKIVVDKENNGFKFKRIIPFAFLFEKPYEGDTFRTELIEVARYKYHDIEDLIKGDDKTKDSALKMFHEMHGDNKNELIEVYEIYKTNGKTAIFTEKMIIKFTDWKYDWYPYQHFIWDKKQTGIIGTGPAELVTPSQRKINALLYRIDKNIEMFTNHYIVFNKNSNFQQMDNGFGRYYEANMMSNSGTGKPLHVTPPIMNQQIFAHLSETYEKGLKCARVSELQAEGRIPNVNQGSAKSVTAYNNIDQSRFGPNIRLYQKNFVELARMCLEWGCDLYPSKSPFKAVKQYGLREFKFKANIFANNLLPETPEAKLEVLRSLVSEGLIKQEKFFELLDMPDVSGYVRSASARETAIGKYLEDKFYKNEKATPDPILGYEEQNDMAIKIYAQIVKESDDHIDDEKLDNIRNFIKVIKEAREKIKVEQLKSITTQNGGIPSGGQTPPQAPSQPNIQSGITQPKG